MAKHVTRLATLSSALVAGLLFTTAPPAQAAEAGGAYASDEWNARASASTTSAVVVRVHALGKGNPDYIVCWDRERCRGQKKGGEYRCTSTGAKYKTWTPLNWRGRKVWVADQCVGIGRVE
ncbi:hypothetical protein [Streptomyces antibioticus]|uniref:hypothetical protein n=1 Tax=Streptomyces antibioticus TaxID=1890 RepID=UPI00225C1258|nr:hypothetical protein [Streptomyces antibioticus]MCX5169879.1 hypothetical protein [Streptomyces antibioticus]